MKTFRESVDAGDLYRHVWNTAFGIPPGDDEKPICGADLSQKYNGAGKPNCPQCVAIARQSGRKIVNEGAFKTIADPDVPERTRLARINKFLSDLGHTYHPGVPLNSIFANLKQNGFEAVDEEGYPWDGLVVGRDSTYNFDLRDLQTGNISKRVLHMSHHKMEVSGNYEVTAYVN